MQGSIFEKEREFRKDFLEKIPTELNCQRCEPKCEGMSSHRDVSGEKTGEVQDRLESGFASVRSVRNPARWLRRVGWLHMSQSLTPLSTPAPFILAKDCVETGRKFQPYLDEQGWALVSLCKEWRRNTSSILQGSWIAQPFAFFSNTGVKTAFLVRKKWTLIMTYQNKKNDVGNTNNTNNFNGICNVSFFQFFIKTFICNNII